MKIKIPKLKTRQIHLLVTEEMLDGLKKVAKKKETNISVVIRALIDKGLK